MYRLKPRAAAASATKSKYSHSTMYLLKRFVINCAPNSSTYSHSTMYLLKLYCSSRLPRIFFYSHSTMYLLKLHRHKCEVFCIKHSHSTMYLLKPPLGCGSCLTRILFTFHHVSIKTISRSYARVPRSKFTFHHVSIKTSNEDMLPDEQIYSHSTMYLLKHDLLYHHLRYYIHSHSTMYLLKRLHSGSGRLSSPIHIPPCIY